ncbi:mitotic deacetylase associated SANT domain protein a [Trichomycterus rosablanca]|uniref:mitotic deacetylase associated SANT domain protein a n=1 Tax=Trichomycterus rosablanca TaxID=2290929 RepID=UPI002F352EE2
MSLSPHQRGNIVKQNIESIEELAQHSGDIYYNVGASAVEQTNSGAAGRTDPNLQGSAVFKPEWGHFQQPGPVKWVHQDPMQTPTWFPNANKLTENFGPSSGRIDDSRGQVLPNINHEIVGAGSSVPFSQASQAVTQGIEWETHNMEAMHHAQFLQQGQKPGDPSYQPQAMCHIIPDSTLQSFQMAFGPTKQLQAPGFLQTFQSGGAPRNLGYSEQQKSQQQLLQQQLQQVQHQQQMHHFQQQQQRLHQYHHQQKMQEQMHQMQKNQLQLQQQQQQQQQQHQHQLKGRPQQASCTSQPILPDQRLARQPQPDNSQLKAESSMLSQQRQPTTIPAQKHEPPHLTNASAKAPAEPQELVLKPEVPPRRSRRLSKDGISPTTSKPPKDLAPNGSIGGHHAATGGVIHSTQRRRRTSKEINLETLAQKASEMECLPAKHDESTPGRPTGMQPLVIPVSVPVRRAQAQMDLAGHWKPPSGGQSSECKPSVIVTRRRSLRASDVFNQEEEEKEGGRSPDKIRRRPRPEPLVIPPPRPCTFIAPSVYSCISSYQSHLRSPVRLIDNPLTFPPYTPPPILSPVREGSGLYFSTFLSSIAAGNQSLPPQPTPKRSLLRSSSSEITPPMPPLIGEATPVSLEPRINISVKYQAEIPEVRERSLVEQDEHRATLVWLPLLKTESSTSQEETVDNLMNLSCSGVFCGGGTNVELMHHCLHENRGDVLKTFEVMFMRNPVFSKDHHLSNYHYAGSDCWSVDEKRYFNKGISAYRKDFFLVQKVVQSKTLAQCVEFYYTYKKQVKVGRNGTFTYGPMDHEEHVPEHKITPVRQEQTEAADESEPKQEPYRVGSENLNTVARTLKVSENEGKVLVLSVPRIATLEEATALRHEIQNPAFIPPKPRPVSTGRRNTPAPKSQGEPEGIFPCKKCSRVFYKVKSRSAHMKSHAEQEKKAAAQRQREEEERLLAARARLEAAEADRVDEEADGEGDEESLVYPDAERDEDWTR